MFPVFSAKRGLALLLCAGLILSCFSGCNKSRTKLPEAPSEPGYLVESLPTEATEETTAPTETEATEPATTEATEPEPDGLKGVIAGDLVNIRTGPGTNFDIAGSYAGGTEVKIYTQIKIGDIIWGCTDKGWISMEYVDMN